VDGSSRFDRDGHATKPAIQNGVDLGFIGAGVAPFEWPEHMVAASIDYKFPLGFAIRLGCRPRTWDIRLLDLDSLKKMLTGLCSFGKKT